MNFTDDAAYRTWRDAKLNDYPRSIEEILIDIDALTAPGSVGKAAISDSCKKSNMAIYRCRDLSSERAAVRTFAAYFGLHEVDHHLCANDDGVSEISVAPDGVRAGYIPYSKHALSWHTDGYYNQATRRIRAVVLHCVSDAESGGVNALLDPEIAFIYLRDRNPDFIRALQHPQCMTIPANTDENGELRPQVSGPVFGRDRSDGSLFMRYSARKRNIRWRDDALTRAAVECLTELLDDRDGPVLRYTLKPGEGLISNNVLHNRTAFKDSAGGGRLLYRARFFNRIKSG